MAGFHRKPAIVKNNKTMGRASGHDHIHARFLKKQGILPAYHSEPDMKATARFVQTSCLPLLLICPFACLVHGKAEESRPNIIFLLTYPGQGHGFFNERKAGTAIFLDTLRKMDAFLVEIGFLKGSPTKAQLQAVSNENLKKGGVNHVRFHGVS